MPVDNFIEVPFKTDNLDRFFVRTSILNAINASLKYFKGNLIDIGCGRKPYKSYLLQNSSITQYVGLDIETAIVYDTGVKPDFTWNGISMPFESNEFETAIGTEVLEHCPKPDVILKEVYRVLKPGGTFFFTVPYLWTLHEVPNDEYRYTPFSLKRILEEAGFSNIEIKSLGGWHASLAQMLGLWVRQAPMTKKKRIWLSYLLKPIINYLIKKDKNLNTGFYEGQMITGLHGICKK